MGTLSLAAALRAFVWPQAGWVHHRLEQRVVHERGSHMYFVQNE
jgi:hypothetical protein